MKFDKNYDYSNIFNGYLIGYFRIDAKHWTRSVLAGNEAIISR